MTNPEKTQMSPQEAYDITAEKWAVYGASDVTGWSRYQEAIETLREAWKDADERLIYSRIDTEGRMANAELRAETAESQLAKANHRIAELESDLVKSGNALLAADEKIQVGRDRADYFQNEVGALRMDLAHTEALLEQAERNYRYVVELAASERLPAYREQAEKLLQSIQRAEAAEAEVARLRSVLYSGSNVCPDCRNVFLQPFRCVTCGAQKLYDATLTNAQQERNALREENKRLRAALVDLVRKIDEATENPDFKRVWVMDFVHGRRYEGPNWTDELKAARDALQRAEGK